MSIMLYNSKTTEQKICPPEISGVEIKILPL